MFKFATLVFVGAVSAFSQNQEATFMAANTTKKNTTVKANTTKAPAKTSSGLQVPAGAKMEKAYKAALKDAQAKLDKFNKAKETFDNATKAYNARLLKKPFNTLKAGVVNASAKLAVAKVTANKTKTALANLKKTDKTFKNATDLNKKAVEALGKATKAVATAKAALAKELKDNADLKALKKKLDAAQVAAEGTEPKLPKKGAAWTAVVAGVKANNPLYKEVPEDLAAVPKAEFTKEVARSALEITFWKKVVDENSAKKSKTAFAANASKAFHAAYTALHKSESAYAKILANSSVNATAADKKAVNLAGSSFETSCAKATVMLAKAMYNNEKNNATKAALVAYYKTYEKELAKNKAAEHKAANGGNGASGSSDKGGSATWIWVALALVVVAAIGLYAYTKKCPENK